MNSPNGDVSIMGDSRVEKPVPGGGSRWTRPKAERNREHEATNDGLGELPFIACLCVTWRRPHLLPNLIHCFLSQDYPASRRELIILDDAGQYPGGLKGPGWRLICVPHRFRTLSSKRNALAAMCGKHVDALAFWDDDDTFFPWTLRAHARALEESSVSHPSMVFDNRVANTLKLKKAGELYQATQAIDIGAFFCAGGYPQGNSGVDQKLTSRLLEMCGGKFGDPCEFLPPWFVYGWGGMNIAHLSMHGVDGYDEPAIANAGNDDVQFGEIVTKPRMDWTTMWRDFLDVPLDQDMSRLEEWWTEHRQRFISLLK